MITDWCCSIHPSTMSATDIRMVKRGAEAGRLSDSMLKSMAHGSAYLHTPWRAIANAELDRRADLSL